MRVPATLPALLPALALALLAAPAPAQQNAGLEARALHRNVIVPQGRVFSAEAEPVRITGVSVCATVLDQAATTRFEITLHNPGRNMAEGEMLLPVPKGAVLGKFDFDGAGTEPSAALLPESEALKIYNEIVRRYRDPALMQFVGCSLVRTSVFPIQPGGVQHLRFTYEHVLPASGDRVDYELPRNEALGYALPWDISVAIQSTRPISTVYSPSHGLTLARKGDNQVLACVAPESRLEPGAFKLSYLLGGDGVSASLFAYPDPAIGGGYFLMIAGLPARLPESAKALRREVTVVFDRSGSMNGDKWRQAVAAAQQVVAGLREDESFNLIAYNDGVDMCFAAPQPRTEENEKAALAFLKRLRPMGGTNLHDALVEALRPKPAEGVVPLVLFLTDGLATVGQTGEKTIRELASVHNPHKRRIFTFGVGVDVNAPLLEAVADASRAAPTFVLPGEDVEVKVGDMARKLGGPVLAEPELEMPRGAQGEARVTELLPRALPDLFEGEQLVLLGKYAGDAPLNFRLKGNYLGTQRVFDFRFGLEAATTRNAFVPRLWAGRRVAELIDAIRQAGADGVKAEDPRHKELVDEIVRLSTSFGILTEYTAFLALEGTNLARGAEVNDQVYRNLQQRGQVERSGNSGVSQSSNAAEMKRQTKENKRNEWMNDRLNRVSVGAVQQAGDRAFFRRDGRWVESRLATRSELKPAREVVAGTPEYDTLVKKLENLGRAGCVSMEGEILLELEGEIILVRPQKE